MPRIGEIRVGVPVKWVYGRDTFVCPICKSVHWYPFKDGCHNDDCPYKGSLTHVPPPSKESK